MKIFEITTPELDMSNPVGFIRSMQKSLGMGDGTGGLSLDNPSGKVTDVKSNNPADKIGSDSKDTISGGKPKPVVDGGPIPLSSLPKSNPAKVDPKQMASYLKSKGLDPEHIGGLLVSVKWECGFRPGVWIASDNNQGPSGGLFGFHNGKKDGTGLFTKMIWACGGLDKWQTNWQGQFDFALQSSTAKSYLSKRFASAGEAASWWVINYEKPADTHGQAVARAKEADRYSYA
jgi:hypothetical protein